MGGRGTRGDKEEDGVVYIAGTCAYEWCVNGFLSKEKKKRRRKKSSDVYPYVCIFHWKKFCPSSLRTSHSSVNGFFFHIKHHAFLGRFFNHTALEHVSPHCLNRLVRNPVIALPISALFLQEKEKKNVVV